MSNPKYTDKNHKPVPELKVGDRCYTGGGYADYSSVHVCEIRKVEVKWVDNHDGSGYWMVDYYIRENVNIPAIKTTRMYAYSLDEGRIYRIYRTPQEVMDENIRYFKQMVVRNAEAMRKTMRKLGYPEEKTRNLLTIKKDDIDNEPEAE